MFEDQYGEFICGYWGLKGQMSDRRSNIGIVTSQNVYITWTFQQLK